MFTYFQRFNGGNFWMEVLLYHRPVGIIREDRFGYYYTSLNNVDLYYPSMESVEDVQHYLEHGVRED